MSNDFQIDHMTLFKRMPIPRFIVGQNNDAKYYIIEANLAALAYFDLAEDKVVGNFLTKFMDHENVRHFEQCFEVCLSRKKTVSIQSLPGMPGKVRVHSFSVSPVFVDDAFSFFDVIGQLEVADQSILQRERDDAISLLTSVFDVSAVGIVVTDAKGSIVRVNESFITNFGWAREDLINVDVSSLVTPDEREVAKSNHDGFIRSGEPGTGEMKLIKKDGSIANALFTTATLELSQKRRFQVTTVIDITLRKQMELSMKMAKDQADSANQAKSTFLANMSHELRTPLNAIIGFSEMMMNETFGALGHKKYTEYTGDVHHSAKHLLEIINDVLDMSKIEAGRIELDEDDVDVRELIESVERMMSSRTFGQKIEIDMKFDEDLPHILADQRLLKQVVINLVTNAIKFSEPGSRIKLESRVLKDGRLEIVIADEGIGIPRDKIKMALEPFGQVSEEGDRMRHEGTGLGLPLSKAMVELHDGSFRLESEVGKGTIVFIKFPSYRVISSTNPVSV